MAVSGINSLILQENEGYNSVGEKIETGIFVKADEHVQVSVEELLTDGMIARMTVKYTALDKKGQKWLEEFKVSTPEGNYALSLKAYMENTLEFVYSERRKQGKIAAWCTQCHFSERAEYGIGPGFVQRHVL